MLAAARPSGDRDFDVARFSGAVDCPDDRINGTLDSRPAGRGKGDDRDAPSGEVLLMLQVQVGCDKDSEAFSLGDVEQLTVREASPAAFVGGCDLVPR